MGAARVRLRTPRYSRNPTTQRVAQSRLCTCGLTNLLASFAEQFVDTSEYYVTSITPNRGTIEGGTRVTIRGGGFNVNFFTAGNYVYLGNEDTDEWVPCDVIEGACSVQCGGPNTLVRLAVRPRREWSCSVFLHFLFFAFPAPVMADAPSSELGRLDRGAPLAPSEQPPYTCRFATRGS